MKKIIFYMLISLAFISNSGADELLKGNRVKLTVSSPSTGDLFTLGDRVTIRWNLPIGAPCGNRVSFFAKRRSNGDEYPIREEYSCRPGLNTFTWIISPSFYSDRTGDYTIRIVTANGCNRESSVFRICTRDEFERLNSTGRCDFSIESVTFSDGRSLHNHGVNFQEGTDITNTFQVNILWNKNEPRSIGHHRIRVKSVMTNENIHQANNPASFSFAEANPRTGMIRILVPFNIAHGKVPSMSRGRFIPLEFSIVLDPATNDSMAVNNKKEYRMRILDSPAKTDFTVNIVPGSIRAWVTNKPFDRAFVYGNVSFTVRYKNMARNEAGGPVNEINNVKLRYEWKPQGAGLFNAGMLEDKTITLPAVSSEWKEKKIQKLEFSMRANTWADFRLRVWIDPNREYIDINRNNNYIETHFNFR